MDKPASMLFDSILRTEGAMLAEIGDLRNRVDVLERLLADLSSKPSSEKAPGTGDD